ncbi:Gfo/Idh/MocA family oxidoreductase [Paraburkholderia rhynchosiae]|uniref:Gfo/Idh/MocA family oxidoreductase n=1 Tax=Paraburkholderia rhynchosiae TaxID=487049 RepID=UPI001304D92E
MKLRLRARGHERGGSGGQSGVDAVLPQLHVCRLHARVPVAQVPHNACPTFGGEEAEPSSISLGSSQISLWFCYNARNGAGRTPSTLTNLTGPKSYSRGESLKAFRMSVLHRHSGTRADVNHRDEMYDDKVPDMIDNAYVIVEFRSGRRASLDLCMFADGAYWQEEFSAVGDKGKIECFVPGASRHWPGRGERQAEVVVSRREPKGPARRTVEVDEHLLILGAHHGSTYFEHLGFQQSVLEGANVRVTVEDGLKAVVIGLAAEQSIRERRVIQIEGLSLH